MDFSLLSSAMASKSYDKIADICDDLMLQAATQGVDVEDTWPYAIHLLAHIYASDESQPEVVAAWKIGQHLWVRDYEGVYETLREFNWSQETQGLIGAFSELYTRDMFELLQSAYSTISIQDTARFLGMNEDDVTKYVVGQDWSVDPTSQMLMVKKQPVVSQQKVNPGKLQRLTEYFFHLEH